MRQSPDPARRLAVVALLLAVGFGPLAGEASSGLLAAGACSDACPDEERCEGGDARCGCCARVAAAVVSVVVAAPGPPGAPAPAGGDAAVPELSVVDRLLDPPRRLVS